MSRMIALHVVVPPDVRDRKSTRLELQSQSNLVCRLLLEKKKGRARALDQRGCEEPGHRDGQAEPRRLVSVRFPPLSHAYLPRLASLCVCRALRCRGHVA